MKRIFKADAATLTVIAVTVSVILLILCAALLINERRGGTPNTTTEQKEITFPDVSDVPAREDIEVTHNVTEKSETYEKEDIEYIYSQVSYPIIAGGIAEATYKINTFLSDFASERVRIMSFEKESAESSYLRAQNNGIEFIPFEFITRCEQVYIKDGYISVVFRQIKTVGITEPTEELITLCFDLLSGEEATLASFMNTDDATASNFVLDIFTQHIEINPRLYYNDALEILPHIIDINLFYLTDEGAVLYFNSGIITPEVYGIREFTVPYDKLGH